jgi:hypothetical protein
MPQDIKSAAGAVMSKPALSGVTLLGALSLCVLLPDIRVAQGESSLPNLSGTYRCVPDTRPCQSTTFTIFQSGGKLDVKGAKVMSGPERWGATFPSPWVHHGTRSARFFPISEPSNGPPARAGRGSEGLGKETARHGLAAPLRRNATARSAHSPAADRLGECRAAVCACAPRLQEAAHFSWLIDCRRQLAALQILHRDLAVRVSALRYSAASSATGLVSR